MTNTNSRMENGANLSQSMDSVNNVNVGGGEEEVNTLVHFILTPSILGNGIYREKAALTRERLEYFYSICVCLFSTLQ